MIPELHSRSAFSFLESPTQPETLVDHAAQIGLPAIALLDRDGLYGLPRFHMAAVKRGITAHCGAELTCHDGARVSLLIRNRTGYQNLCRLITRMKMRSPKGEGAIHPDELEEFRSGLVLLTRDVENLDRWQRIFDHEHIYLELQRHFDRQQEALNQAIIDLSKARKLPLLATNGARYAQKNERQLLDVVTCIRHKTTLSRAGRLLAKNDHCHLKTPREMQQLFRDVPHALAAAIDLSDSLDFTLADLGYEFPRYPVPEGESMPSFLRKRTYEGAIDRYGALSTRVHQQLERELQLITQLKLEGYFLIVWDIIRFCRQQGILVQGRGSAANSAVCYSLGITAVDPIGMELLFERFLSEERGEWPDIDLDLPSGDRRERAIQYVYERYGKLGAAMTANVITYRGRSAAREVGKVMELPIDTITRLASHAYHFEFRDPTETHERQFAEAGLDRMQPYIAKYFQLFREIQNLPRHLGQHSGGLVICQGQLDSVVPLENASMPGRVVVQWDKEDCADMGIVKVDLLGLGMMAVLEDSIGLIRDHYGEEVDLAKLPADDPGVYDDLQRADTIGVFQVESRAQQASLPQIKPKKFYDIVVQTAIIRPGPIVGKMIHPYIRRRQGKEVPEPLHPLLEPILARTLGVPLFQEQLLRMAMVVADFTGGEAEELRRAMGFKRSRERMLEIESRLRAGMTKKGISAKQQEAIILSITSFALYGFPESHAASFALLAYASIYLRRHYRAAFTAALLNNYPMGFYHPDTIIKDAQRHGLRVLAVDVTSSDYACSVQQHDEALCLRLGMNYVKGMSAASGQAIEAERHKQAFSSLEDLVRRVPELRRDEMEKLARIGALNHIEGERALHRRSALWKGAAAVRPVGPLFEQADLLDNESPLPAMTEKERMMADYLGTTTSIGRHPMAVYRERLGNRRLWMASELKDVPRNTWVTVGGAVIVRQRPGTAKGFFFVSLEDESGIHNIICEPQFYDENRAILKTASFMIVTGVLQNQSGSISVKARKVEELAAALALETRWG
jgi:error-prone DNA polymerase